MLQTNSEPAFYTLNIGFIYSWDSDNVVSFKKTKKQKEKQTKTRSQHLKTQKTF